jgi:hypothetical protein
MERLMDFLKNSAVDLRQALVAIAQVRPNPRNARTHSKKQIRQIAASITSFGSRRLSSSMKTVSCLPVTVGWSR